MRGPEQVCVSAVSVAELFAGLRPELRREWRDFLHELTHFDVTQDIALLAGTLRYDHTRRGQVIQIPDALIAATAIVYGAELVTANIRDFASVGVTIFVLRS
jgi:predicted nucleic acid-binding protein